MLKWGRRERRRCLLLLGGWQRWLSLPWGSSWLLEVAEIILCVWDALSTELESDALQHSTAIQ